MEDDLTDVLDRVYAHLVRLHLPVAALLRPGLSGERIEELTRLLPFRLPREIYALYQWRDGVPPNRYDTALFPSEGTDWVFVSLEDAITSYQSHSALAREYGGDDWEMLWHPRWFPVFENDVPTSLCVLGQDATVDTAPILDVDVEGFSHDEQYVSLTHLFQVVDECYETGAFYVAENGALVADDARVGAVRRRHAPERADTAIETLRRASVDAVGPEYARAINDVITFHDTRAIAPLLHALEVSGMTNTGAIVALGVLGGEEVVEPLLRLVRQGPSLMRDLTGMAARWAEVQHYMNSAGATRSHVRGSAMQSVVGLAERLHLLLPAEPFVACLRDPYSYIRQRAIWALEHIGTAEARNALAAAARDSRDDDLRRAAQQALDRLNASDGQTSI